MKKNLRINKEQLENPDSIKIAIVQSNYHSELNGNMTEYCKEVLFKNNILESNVSVYYAPGAWEVPLIVRKIANTGNYDAIVAFGIIIKGDTYHFEMIANEVARSLMETAVINEIPVGFEILAVNNIEQAEERASRNNYNKGIEVGNAILAALSTLRTVQSRSQKRLS